MGLDANGCGHPRLWAKPNTIRVPPIHSGATGFSISVYRKHSALLNDDAIDQLPHWRGDPIANPKRLPMDRFENNPKKMR
jgi:hypothetical protein